MMKSFIATVSPAPASAKIVANWLGMPKIISRIRMASAARVTMCSDRAQGQQFLLVRFHAREHSLQKISREQDR